MEVMPEISISTNAGGWGNVGFEVPCPKQMCEKARDLPQDINDKNLLPVIMAVIYELIFTFSSLYIHLGTDERQESMTCFQEANIVPNFDLFERNMRGLLEMQGITPDRIVRWENKENRVYPGRLGSITQCRSKDCRTDQSTSATWFTTVNLGEGGGWNIYQSTRLLALLRPHAILANIDKLNIEYFQQHQMQHRLLAFAMGTADMPDMNRTTFEEEYIRLCHNLSLTLNITDCESFASSDIGIDEVRAYETAGFLEQTCNSRTVEAKQHFFRETVPAFYELEQRNMSVSSNTSHDGVGAETRRKEGSTESMGINLRQ